MSLVIMNNLMAVNANRNLANHYGNLADSTRKLSSGLRIDRAADDVAGLAVRELMRANIGVLNQGVRNANDAISLVQTADGSLQIIDEKLIRMKELAEQAATGTYDSVQRGLIDSEYQQMASEITRIAAATEFNGIKLLDGTLSSNTHSGEGVAGNANATGKLKVHFGTGNESSEDYYYIKIGEVSAAGLGVGNETEKTRAGYDISTQENAQKSLKALSAAITSKDLIRADLGAIQNRLENTVSNLTIESENLQASESRISDVDVATEMTNFVRNQTLANAANSMLSQANQIPQMALRLLG